MNGVEVIDWMGGFDGFVGLGWVGAGVVFFVVVFFGFVGVVLGGGGGC